MRKLAAIGIIILLQSACRGDAPPERSSITVATTASSSQSTVSGRSVPPDSLRDDLVEHGLRVLDGPRQAVIAQLGQPDSIRSQTEQNPHNPAQADSTVEFFYPGLRLSYYVVGERPTRDILQTADVWDNRYLKYPEIGVGASAAAIVSALGEPGERTNDRYSYDCGRCIGAETPVYFHLGGGRVKFVQYTFYVD
jgi:hypothetical protein